MDREKTRQAAEQVFRDMAGAMTAGMVYVGTRTGLFRAMRGKGPMQLEQVVRESGLQSRYVDEWLKGMASAGYLVYEPGSRSFTLPDEHAWLLASEGTDHFAGGMFEMVPVLMRFAPRVAEAFASGGGVRFEEFGPDCVTALDLINRGQYEHRFTEYWVQALPDVVRKLEAGGRMLDIGCGSGRVCLAFANAYPKAHVTGIDPDASSIARARQLGSRVDFAVGTAATLAGRGRFDLITMCDCLHDLAEPVRTLRDVHALLEPGGTLFVVEPRAADRLEENRNPVATMFYGFSIFHCMTQSLARGGPGLGTCMGPAMAERLLRDAGFSSFEILPLKSQVNAFYAARP